MLKSKSYLNDIHLPYLKYALDEDIVRHYCQALLADKTDISIIGCRVVKLRHRRAKRSTIQYEMTLRVANGSPQTHWLVGYQFADAGKFRSVSRRFKKLCAGPEPVDGLPPGFVIEAIGLLLQRFPFDRHLPELSSLYFNLDQVVSDQLPELLGSHDWKVECLDTRPVRWRAGLTAVTELCLRVKHRHSGAFQQHKFFAKMDATGTDSDTLLRLCQSQSLGKLPFNLAQKLVSIPQQGFTIQRCADGVSLGEMLLRGALKLSDARRLGRVLARWHGSGETLHNQYSREKFESALGRSVRVLGSAVPTCNLRLNRLADRICRRMHHDVYCPTHLDLKPEHIFFGAGGISLIDMDMAADADPMLDIAILYARMRHASALYDLPHSASHFFTLQLINTYHQLVPSSWWRNFSVCYAWALLKVAAALYQRQRPDWQNWIGRLVNEAEQVLIDDRRKLPFLSMDNHRAKSAHRRESDPAISVGAGITG